MIDIRTLRFGNMVETLDGEAVAVESFYVIIHGETVQTVVNSMDESDLRPIKLTNEMLDTFANGIFKNFRGIKINEDKSLFAMVSTLDGDEWCLLYLKDKAERIQLAPIEHFHELQNVYFAIAQKELTAVTMHVI